MRAAAAIARLARHEAAAAARCACPQCPGTRLARLALLGARHQAALVPTLHGVHPATTVRPAGCSASRRTESSPAHHRSPAHSSRPGFRRQDRRHHQWRRPSSGRPKRQADLRRSLDLGQGPLVVGIGRLTEQKNWPVFIEAASRVNGPCFAIAGDGPLRQQLVGLANRHGSPVRILGVVDDIPALVGIASCVVSTSTWEGLPLALLEALSLGAPVVATAVDGITDLVPLGAALLVPPGRSGRGQCSDISRPERRVPCDLTAGCRPGCSRGMETRADAQSVPQRLPGSGGRETSVGLTAPSVIQPRTRRERATLLVPPPAPYWRDHYSHPGPLWPGWCAGDWCRGLGGTAARRAGLRRSVCSRPGRALFGKSLSMQDEWPGACSSQISKPLSACVDGGSDGRPDRQTARAHRPEQGPQSDESHPSIRGVSSRTGIDKASEVGRHWVGGSVGSWLKMGGRCRGSLAGKRAEVEVGHARSPRDL